MTAPESVRDRLARRARELRGDAAAMNEPYGAEERAVARALEEVVAALDGASAWLAGNPGGENGRRSEQEPADGDFEGETDGDSPLVAWERSWGRTE